MTPEEIRLECLKLILDFASNAYTATCKEIISDAEEMANFVMGIKGEPAPLSD